MAILSEAPADADVLDLEALRVARAEARAAAGKKPPFLKFAAGYVQVKPEVPVEVSFAIDEGDVKGALAGLLADPADFDLLIKDGLSDQDLKEILEFVAGKNLGESGA